MRVSPARKLAFDVLRRVESEGAFAADLLHAQLERRPELKREDAALATELTLGVLRWQRLLDVLMESGAGRPVAQFDAEVRLALRLGLYQLRFLERIPVHAAVNESVELVRQARKASAVGLVNAVLRRASKQKTAPPLSAPKAGDSADALGVRFSHPTWLVARWMEHFGEKRAMELLAANNRAPHATAVLHGTEAGGEAARALRQAGIVAEPAKWLRAAWRLSGGNPAKSAAFRRGWISLQDEASQMVALLLDVRAGQSVLDLCAAPGGKTVTLARGAGRDSLVVAADLHLHRLRALRGNLKRAGLSAHLVALEATAPLPLARHFDRILVDAPCSGTGTLARNPEIRWRLRPDDLLDLQLRQKAILRNALHLLAPGGRLVYATCSLEAEENEDVVRAALAERPDIRLASGADALRPHLGDMARAGELFDAQGFFRTFPHVHGTDGFFAAVLERRP
jgi:16S rRNA (cytosine967-C5)-methyltransferase